MHVSVAEAINHLTFLFNSMNANLGGRQSFVCWRFNAIYAHVGLVIAGVANLSQNTIVVNVTAWRLRCSHAIVIGQFVKPSVCNICSCKQSSHMRHVAKEVLLSSWLVFACQIETGRQEICQLPSKHVLK